MPTGSRPGIAAIALAVVLGAFPAARGLAGDAASPSADSRDARQAELDAVTRDIALSDERLAELKAEIDKIDKDRSSLNANLVETGKRVEAFEVQIGDTERRMQALSGEEEAVRSSLVARRDVLAEVLAALQRMGHRPPPALLVRPEDALASVRSAILLGAVVPDLRAAADKLAADLKQLAALKTEIAGERQRLLADATSLAEERARVQMLLDERRNQREASTAALADEEKKTAELADQASGLKELISGMEQQIASAAAAKASADRATEAAQAKPSPAKPASLGRPDRLTPALAFADAHGLLPKPVVGRQVKGFGEPDGNGAKTLGISIAARAGAQVTSPTDGWVVYAGPFRSYGQLLIVNAGGGYHVLLAGMERIDVQLGQFVLAGEPVAVMAAQRLASTGAVDIVSTQQVLYIEFRKDGNSIDPAPWWAASSDEKVGG